MGREVLSGASQTRRKRAPRHCHLKSNSGRSLYWATYRRNSFANQCTFLEEHLSLAKELLDKEMLLADDSSLQVAYLFWPQYAAPAELRRVITVGRSLIDGCKREHLPEGLHAER